MNIEDIRLTRGEIGQALRDGFPSSDECSVTDYLANTATDKAIKKIVEYLESKGDWILNYEITEQERIWNWAIPHDDYIALKKLVEEV